MKIIVLIINLLTAVSLFSADYMPQEDYYFGYSRTDIKWAVATGFSTGTVNGYLDMQDGVNADLEVIRIMLRISPAYLHIDHLWLSESVGVTEYETDQNIYKIFAPEWTLGFALKLSEQGFFQNLYPYLGGGCGLANYNVKSLVPESKSKVNSENGSEEDNGSQSGIVYIQVAGLEYSLTSFVSICFEERFTWGSYTRRNNYLPADYDSDKDEGQFSPSQLGPEGLNKSFRKEIVDVKQVTLRFGVRIYWGQNLFD